VLLFGFASESTLQTLQHLIAEFGNITANNLDKNSNNPHKYWSPNQPIEDLFNQIRASRVFTFNFEQLQ
jgi:hypothetical protein